MTMHEALYFLDWLHGEIHEQGSFTDKGSWPTKELVNVNLDGNRPWFPRDRKLQESFNRNFSIARARQWTVVAPCSKQCHAKHLMLTRAGSAVLEVMNREGCGWSAQLRFVKEAA
jgi:uncharacterized protein (DUF4415 family)